MKKYWKLIVISVVTCFILGFFYVKNATYSEQLPQFTIQPIEGDEAVAESLTVYGQRYDGMNHIEQFQIDQKGTKYLRDEAYFKRLTGYHLKQEIDSWQSDYHHFMRGKDEDMGLFYEGADRLAYASVISSSPLIWVADTLDIHMLDKETKNQRQFQVQLPNASKYWYQDIAHVYMTDNELTVIMESNYEGENESTGVDLILLTLDMETEQLVEEENLYQSTAESDEMMYEEITLHTSDQDEAHVVIAKQRTNYEDEETTDGEVTDSNHVTKTDELMKYNLQTKKTEQIAIPKEMENATFITFDEERVYFADNTSSNIRIIPYHVADETVQEAWEVDVPRPQDSLWAGHATIENNKLFYLHEVYDGVQLSTIVVLDLKKEQLDYVGEVVVNKEYFDTEEIYLDQLIVQ